MTSSELNDTDRARLELAWRNASDDAVARALRNMADYPVPVHVFIRREADQRGIEPGTMDVDESPAVDLRSTYAVILGFTERWRFLLAFLFGLVIRLLAFFIDWNVVTFTYWQFLAVHLSIYHIGLALLCVRVREYRTPRLVALAGATGYNVGGLVDIARRVEVLDIEFVWIPLMLLLWAALWLITYGILSLVVTVLRRTRPIYPPGHCRQCGYDLRGLPEPQCPEC